MATAKSTTPDLNKAADQATRLNAPLIETGKRAAGLYLDGFDKLIDQVTSRQQKFVERSPDETLKSVVNTQVELTRQFTSGYTSAARELIA